MTKIISNYFKIKFGSSNILVRFISSYKNGIKKQHLNLAVMKSQTFKSTIVVKGVEFITYKHWSYDGNVGIYLADNVSCIGEIINNEPVFFTNFTKEQIEWMNINHPIQANIGLAK